MGCYVCICNGPVLTWLFTKQFKDDGWNSSTVWCTNILNSFICRKLLYLLPTQNEGEIRDGIKFKTFNSGNRVVHKSFEHVLMFIVSIVSIVSARNFTTCHTYFAYNNSAAQNSKVSTIKVRCSLLAGCHSFFSLIANITGSPCIDSSASDTPSVSTIIGRHLSAAVFSSACHPITKLDFFHKWG